MHSHSIVKRILFLMMLASLAGCVSTTRVTTLQCQGVQQCEEKAARKCDGFYERLEVHLIACDGDCEASPITWKIQCL